MSYKFSMREKVLLGVFVAIIAFLAWFMLVFQPSTARITELEGDIADSQGQITIAATQVSQLNQMKEEIAARKDSGAKPVEVPEYDNVRPLMAQLNSIMSATDTYTLNFDEISYEDDYVLRPVRIDFGCASYAAAESVIDALANGAYPCTIDAVSIVDKAARSSGSAAQASAGVSTSSSSGDSPFGAFVSVTFFERVS